MHFLMRFEKKWKVNEAGTYREGYSEGGKNKSVWYHWSQMVQIDLEQIFR